MFLLRHSKSTPVGAAAMAAATATPASSRTASTLYAQCKQQQQHQHSQHHFQGMSSFVKTLGTSFGVGVGALIAAGSAVVAEDKGWLTPDQRKAAAAAAKEDGEEADETVLVNWSGTHTASTSSFHEPDTITELETIVAQNHAQGKRTRVVGSAISPNGLGLSDDGMLSIACLDKVLAVDREKMTCRVEAGARVSQVVDELREHGLTMQNYASIRDQQMGGFVQVGAHGTGATIPPVDEQVIAFKLVTPGEGTLELSADSNPDLFRAARVGLGSCGVMAEVTLQCVLLHTLVEETEVLTRAEIKAGHAERLAANKHVRYMWIPYTDSVVVVKCNELVEGKAPPAVVPMDGATQLEPLRQLLLQFDPTIPAKTLDGLSFSGLRDRLLTFGATDASVVQVVNAAEAEFWKRCQGVTAVDHSDMVLGFDCGGSQLVNERAFPAGTVASPSMADIAVMEKILALIEAKQIPAPAPIEQRWTCGSTSSMNIAGGKLSSAEDLYSWVGIIHYFGAAEAGSSEWSEITDSFDAYNAAVSAEVDDDFDAYVHWAKLEVPETEDDRAALRARLAKRFPVEEFNFLRMILDPKNILANAAVDEIFGVPS